MILFSTVIQVFLSRHSFLPLLQDNNHDNSKGCGEMDRLNLLIHNLDLSYRLEWSGERQVKLSRHGHQLGIFQL